MLTYTPPIRGASLLPWSWFLAGVPAALSFDPSARNLVLLKLSTLWAGPGQGEG